MFWENIESVSVIRCIRHPNAKTISYYSLLLLLLSSSVSNRQDQRTKDLFTYSGPYSVTPLRRDDTTGRCKCIMYMISTLWFQRENERLGRGQGACTARNNNQDNMRLQSPRT